VSKIDIATRRVIYRTYVGHGEGLALAVDSSGNAYVAGKAAKNDFPATRTYVTPGTGLAAFVVKLDTGGLRAYATLVGGGESLGSGIAVDGEGNAYVAGSSHTDDFPTTANAFDRTFNGGGTNDPPSDAVVFKVAPDGSLLYSTYLGGGGYEEAGGIAVDSSGNAYVAGWTFSSNFPTTAAAFQPTSGSDGDAFVTKLNASGSALVYSTYLGGFAGDFGRAIAVDSSGHALVAGDTLSTNFPTTPDAHRTSYQGNAFDLFVTKLEPGTGWSTAPTSVAPTTTRSRAWRWTGAGPPSSPETPSRMPSP